MQRGGRGWKPFVKVNGPHRLRVTSTSSEWKSSDLKPCSIVAILHNEWGKMETAGLRSGGFRFAVALARRVPKRA